MSVVCFKSDKMGMGADDLGAILIQGFINKVKEMPNKPDIFIFYNSAVKLVAGDSPVLAGLQEIHQSGVKFPICGTCSDFFKVKEDIQVGTISNMHEIVST